LIYFAEIFCFFYRVGKLLLLIEYYVLNGKKLIKWYKFMYMYV
jgi:hypothetical protein